MRGRWHDTTNILYASVSHMAHCLSYLSHFPIFPRHFICFCFLHTGDWISRTLLSSWVNGSWSKAKGGRERGKDYNHSTFVDLIISGLIGIRPRSKDILVVSPLVPVDAWDYFCLDGVLYRQRILTVIWDRTGERYGRGAGFQVLVDGKRLARAETLTRLRLRLPPLGPISASAPVEVSISERGTPSGAGAGAGADLGALQ